MNKVIYSREHRIIVFKLRKSRKEAGLTQEEVAKRISRPQSFVSKCEAGQRRLDIVELKLFANLYKKDLNYFIK